MKSVVCQNEAEKAINLKKKNFNPWARSEQKQYSKSKEPYLVDHVVAGAQIVIFEQFNGLAFGKDSRKKN